MNSDGSSDFIQHSEWVQAADDPCVRLKPCEEYEIIQIEWRSDKRMVSI